MPTQSIKISLSAQHPGSVAEDRVTVRRALRPRPATAGPAHLAEHYHGRARRGEMDFETAEHLIATETTGRCHAVRDVGDLVLENARLRRELDSANRTIAILERAERSLADALAREILGA